MIKRSKKVQNHNQTLTKKGIGFEWNVTTNYFNKHNCESDESDRVRQYIINYLTRFFKFLYKNVS